MADTALRLSCQVEYTNGDLDLGVKFLDYRVQRGPPGQPHTVVVQSARIASTLSTHSAAPFAAIHSPPTMPPAAVSGADAKVANTMNGLQLPDPAMQPSRPPPPGLLVGGLLPAQARDTVMRPSSGMGRPHSQSSNPTPLPPPQPIPTVSMQNSALEGLPRPMGSPPAAAALSTEVTPGVLPVGVGLPVNPESSPWIPSPQHMAVGNLGLVVQASSPAALEAAARLQQQQRQQLEFAALAAASQVLPTRQMRPTAPPIFSAIAHPSSSSSGGPTLPTHTGVTLDPSLGGDTSPPISNPLSIGTRSRMGTRSLPTTDPVSTLKVARVLDLGRPPLGTASPAMASPPVTRFNQRQRCVEEEGKNEAPQHGRTRRQAPVTAAAVSVPSTSASLLSPFHSVQQIVESAHQAAASTDKNGPGRTQGRVSKMVQASPDLPLPESSWRELTPRKLAPVQVQSSGAANAQGSTQGSMIGRVGSGGVTINSGMASLVGDGLNRVCPDGTSAWYPGLHSNGLPPLMKVSSSRPTVTSGSGDLDHMLNAMPQLQLQHPPVGKPTGDGKDSYPAATSASTAVGNEVNITRSASVPTASGIEIGGRAVFVPQMLGVSTELPDSPGVDKVHP